MNFIKSNTYKTILFIFLPVILILLKFFLVANNAIHINYGPHDDSLYITRALSLLLDGDFGNYDSRLLVKLPGFSYFLAFIRTLGLPYLFTINFLYVLSGIYIFIGLRKFKINNYLLLVSFVFFLFNPITFDGQWFRLLREPLSIILLLFMTGSMLHILSSIKSLEKNYKHFLLLAVTFTFSLVNREEDILLYLYIVPFLILVFFEAHNLKLNVLAQSILKKNFSFIKIISLK